LSKIASGQTCGGLARIAYYIDNNASCRPPECRRYFGENVLAFLRLHCSSQAPFTRMCFQLLGVADRKAVGYEALCAHHHRSASLRIPGGTAQDLVTPQGFKLGHCLLDLVTTPGGLAMPVVELIRRCGLHHSLGLRMATNFIVNVIYYSYREACRLSAHRENARRTCE
jgi:hypothetical protein